MAVSSGVSLQSVLGTLVGCVSVSTFTVMGASVLGTISVVGDNCLIYSPAGSGRSAVIPFTGIDHFYSA